jgi:hypothetical protein
MIGRKA